MDPHSNGGVPAHVAAYLYALRSCALNTDQIWVDYLIMGGTYDLGRFNQGLTGTTPFPADEHDRLAAALNDQLIERGDRYRVPYSDAGPR